MLISNKYWRRRFLSSFHNFRDQENGYLIIDKNAKKIIIIRHNFFQERDKMLLVPLEGYHIELCIKKRHARMIGYQLPCLLVL